MQNQKDDGRDNLVAVLASILPALAQLAGVVAIGFSEIFKFSSLFFARELLSVVNLLSIVTVIAMIARFSWEDGKGVISIDKDGKYVQPEKKIHKKLGVLFWFQSLSFILFLALVLLHFYNETFGWPNFVLALIQYLSYSIFIVSSGMGIYIWLSDYVKKRQAYRQEDFIPNLINSLRKNGLLPDLELKINKNRPWPIKEPGSFVFERFVEVIIANGSPIYLKVNYDGLDLGVVSPKETAELRKEGYID